MANWAGKNLCPLLFSKSKCYATHNGISARLQEVVGLSKHCPKYWKKLCEYHTASIILSPLECICFMIGCLSSDKPKFNHWIRWDSKIRLRLSQTVPRAAHRSSGGSTSLLQSNKRGTHRAYTWRINFTYEDELSTLTTYSDIRRTFGYRQKAVVLKIITNIMHRYKNTKFLHRESDMFVKKEMLHEIFAAFRSSATLSGGVSVRTVVPWKLFIEYSSW